MEPTESLRTYAVEKISKIKKYLDHPLEATAVLTVEKFRHVADVTVSVNGTRIKGVEQTGDMYSAIDQVMDKIEKQVKRHLSKIRDHRSENQKGEGTPLIEVAEEAAAMEEPAIEVEEMVAKPMDPEEAAMQLSLSRREFLVFRNDKTQKINVIYKKGDGNLGLIQPTG
jgi:putative sigma-54 modulation protein